MNVMKYWRIAFLLLKQNLLRELLFRGNFFLSIGANLLWLLVSIIFFGAIYLHVPSIGGWTMEEILLLVSISEIVHLMYKGLLGQGVARIPNLIRTGQLDHLLLKPIDSQFLVSLHRVDYHSLISLIFPLLLLVYSAKRLNVSLDIVQTGVFLLLLFVGVFVLYSVGLFIVSLAFWLTQVQALYALFQEIFALSAYPESIFHGALRMFFTFIVPVIVIANFPTFTVIGKDVNNLWLFVILVSCLWGWVARWMWIYGMKHYASASS